MLNDNKTASRAELESENRKLRASLSRCQEMVAECRERLAAQTLPSTAATAESDGERLTEAG